LEPEEFDSAEPEGDNSGGAPAVDVGYVNNVSEEELDELPYGLIVLDAEGKVLFYNETESKLAGYEREQVVGKNFFDDVAPCTRVKQFQGRFEKFVDGELGRTTFFDFAFHFESGTQDVTIALSHGRRRGHFNVMLMRQ
jgi:photoactive yellow protein